MVTIADVAAQAGVGAGTVSRVLNDRPKVSPTTRARVLAAIDELGYRPNPHARGLVLGRCQTLGVVVPFFTHASAVERLRGIVAALRDSRYDVVLFNVESAVHRDEHFAVADRPRPRRRLAGHVDPAAPGGARSGCGWPASRSSSSTRSATGSPCVVIDDVEGGRIATRHLLGLGHREIAFIGDTPDNAFGFTSSAKRQKGYEEVLHAAGIRVRQSYIRHGPHERETARRLADRLLSLSAPPTAIFAASDVQAIGVLEAAKARRIDVPGDLSVVGFDDIEISAYVGLTTVRQPLFDSGYLGAHYLLDALEGRGHVVAVAPPAARARRAIDDRTPPKEPGPVADIVLDDVWKVYADGTEAVRALDLDIADGEFMVLVGPSGCGKTTALRMVAGLEAISKGTRAASATES